MLLFLGVGVLSGKDTITVKGCTDSFEYYEDFVTGEFGEWLAVDKDNLSVFPIGLGSASNLVSFPGLGRCRLTFYRYGVGDAVVGIASPTFFVGMGEMLTFAETNEKNGQR